MDGRTNHPNNARIYSSTQNAAGSQGPGGKFCSNLVIIWRALPVCTNQQDLSLAW